MKHSVCRDLGVFDFKEEDELKDTYNGWSRISGPNSEDPAIKYQFLQYASTASITQMKGHMVGDVHLVAIDDDDDDDDLINDATNDGLDLMKSATSKLLEGFDIVSDKALNEHIVNPESSCKDAEINVPRSFRSFGETDLICPIVPESPSTNDSVDSRTPDSNDSIKEKSPSTPNSLVKESSVPRNIRAVDHSFSSLEMDDMDAILLHTDYATYHMNYFPASLILFSNSYVKLKTSLLEDESSSCTLEWDINDIVGIESCWSSVASIAEVKINLSTKDAMQEGDAQDKSVAIIEVLKFLVHDPGWYWMQERIMSLDMRYKTAWRIGLNGGSSDLVDNNECSSYPYVPNFEEPFKEVIYPKGDVDAVSISKRDVDLLQPETFVNDTIIDFYIKYLKNQILAQERHRYHFFNSFFFRKLADLDKNPSSAFDSKTAFQRVHKWTRKVNIFEKDYLFIPVNYNLHWSLIVICHPGAVANVNCESIDECVKVPCILHMDSIRGSHTGLKDLVQSYLLEEWKERKKETSEDISSNFQNLRFLSLELPQQENCSDCGLFLLHYVELFLAEAPANFNPFMINKFENFLKPDWFMPAEASLKRVHIQRLIYELLESRSSSSTSSNHSESLPLPQPENEDNGIEVLSEKKSPRKSCNTNLTYSQSVQGIEAALLDVSLCRTYDSGLQIRELLEHDQLYDEGVSSGQKGCQNPTIRVEEDAVDYFMPSTLGGIGFKPVDEVESGACHIRYSSRDCNSHTWNSESSDHAEQNRNSSPMSNCFSVDSLEMEIIEVDLEKHVGSSGQNRNFDCQKENVDHLTESYASASSNMKEITPPEDSQELDKIEDIFKHDQVEEKPSANLDVLIRPFDQELVRNEDGTAMAMVVKDSSSDSDSDEELATKRGIVKDSSSDSDEEHATKRIRLNEERKFVRSLSKEV